MADSRDPDGSTRITSPASTTQPSASQHAPTSTGADVTGRMAGTSPRPTAGTALAHKTSAAAVFALVFGLAALFCALTAILAPAAVVFGLIGIVLGIVGLKMAKRPGVTGRSVALGGLVTAVLGLLLGGAVLGGLAAVVNSDGQLDRITNQIDELRAKLPTGDEVQNTVTNP